MKQIDINHNLIQFKFNYKNIKNILIMKVDLEDCNKNMKEFQIH